MTISIKTNIEDSYKADIYRFDLTDYGFTVDFEFSNSISWDIMKARMTKTELKGLADFINTYLEN
jgi:hypothetical protein